LIPFNKPYQTGKELGYIAEAHNLGHLSGDGKFTKLCQEYLERLFGTRKALLTQSCTVALEMAAILLDLSPGEEVIMPSYTFVSTANAFVLRGAVPVFVDVRNDNLNIDESKIEEAITSRTKAIVVVHYAGVACEMDLIMEIANRHGLFVIEDAAQAIYSKFKGMPLGSIGNLGCVSFHETKNVTSGEGGALLVNDPNLVTRAEIIREKGTDRSSFLRGQVDKYTWRDIGSSFLPSELTAAYLWGQLTEGEQITKTRVELWQMYQRGFEELETRGHVLRPVGQDEQPSNGHLYFLILKSKQIRNELIDSLSSFGISAVFHYVPLHESQGGQKFGRVHGDMNVTEDIPNRLIRLPLYPELGDDVHTVIQHLNDFFLG
jgi:dTDP-4-amino-4,6-dideoxygalactose transaminase